MVVVKEFLGRNDMTNAEAIEEIKSRISTTEYVGGSYVDCVDLEALKLAVKALEAQEWIPCKERLPEDEQLVLVTYKTTDRLHICRYHDDGSRNQWYSLNDMCRAYKNVVLAWKPLPEPYKEDGDGDEDR